MDVAAALEDGASQLLRHDFDQQLFLGNVQAHPYETSCSNQMPLAANLNKGMGTVHRLMADLAPLLDPETGGGGGDGVLAALLADKSRGSLHKLDNACGMVKYISCYVRKPATDLRGFPLLQDMLAADVDKRVAPSGCKSLIDEGYIASSGRHAVLQQLVARLRAEEPAPEAQCTMLSEAALRVGLVAFARSEPRVKAQPGNSAPEALAKLGVYLGSHDMTAISDLGLPASSTVRLEELSAESSLRLLVRLVRGRSNEIEDYLQPAEEMEALQAGPTVGKLPIMVAEAAAVIGDCSMAFSMVAAQSCVLKLYIEMLEGGAFIFELRLGQLDLSKVSSAGLLAALHDAKGNYAAEVLYATVLAMCEDQLGPSHLVIVFHSATSLCFAGPCETSAARNPLFERALAIHEQLQMRCHPAGPNVLNSLAVLHNEMRSPPLGCRCSEGRWASTKSTWAIPPSREFAAAQSMFERALGIRWEVKLGPSHPLHSLIHQQYRAAQLDKDNHAAARPLLQRTAAGQLAGGLSMAAGGDDDALWAVFGEEEAERGEVGDGAEGRGAACPSLPAAPPPGVRAVEHPFFADSTLWPPKRGPGCDLQANASTTWL
eukprot:jgi/Tetstr1/425291/TSEL_015742.t1